MDRDRWYANLQKPCPEAAGTRIELVSMRHDPDPVPSGTQGVVEGGNAAQMSVKWDNGRTLYLLPGEDEYKVVSRPS